MASKTLFPLRKMGILIALFLFGGGSLLFFLETTFLIPALQETTDLKPIVLWFLIGSLGLFVPLLGVAIFMLKKEGAWSRPGCWSERLRFRSMEGADWLWGLGAMIICGVLSYGILLGLQKAMGQMPASFLSMETIPSSGSYKILFLFIPFWILNVISEEVLWRGVMFPRQEALFGKATWIVNGLGWSLFHIAFGWESLLVLIPFLFILPYVVQKRKNSWVGVIIHGGGKLFIFLAFAFGVM